MIEVRTPPAVSTAEIAAACVLSLCALDHAAKKLTHIDNRLLCLLILKFKLSN